MPVEVYAIQKTSMVYTFLFNMVYIGPVLVLVCFVPVFDMVEYVLVSNEICIFLC